MVVRLSVAINTALARELISTQFPKWADLPIKPVQFDGWDNRTFLLGDDMTVRLPSGEWYALQVEKEQRWLPKLAPQLPLPIPVALAMGVPGCGYPWHWSVYRWLDGETAMNGHIANLTEFATSLAEFLTALQRIDSTGGPPPGAHNFYRGGPLTVYEDRARQAISALDGKIDSEFATEVLDVAVSSAWQREPVWFHGDVASGNILVKDGRLSAIIDFGTSGVGDPACDLAIAWTLFEGESREAFRSVLPLDDATWARGRGWTLWKALIVYAGFTGANTLEVENQRRVIDEVLADHKRSG
jgi:aminoglycoside phosphotransferase (APT) family kinase protein